jgi:hypothetical protein
MNASIAPLTRSSDATAAAAAAVRVAAMAGTHTATDLPVMIAEAVVVGEVAMVVMEGIGVTGRMITVECHLHMSKSKSNI